jgi:hypothetical protein
MTRRKKTLLGSLIIILAMPIIELLREYVVYRYSRWKLNAAAQQLKSEMSREQVTQIMGKPPLAGDLGSLESGTFEVWNWKSAEAPGFLWRRLVPGEGKPPLEVTAFFFQDKGGLSYVIIENNP